jgi:ribosomal protein S3
MGQKVNPHGLRVGVIKDWDSKWYAEADFADNLIEDYEIRTILTEHTLRKSYTAQVFLRLKSKDHLTE